MKDLLSKFSISPKDINLFIKSLTHSSYQNEHQNNKGDLEKLEFVGDAVLQLLVSEMIYTKNSMLSEGTMSLMRSKLVRSDSLYNLAKSLDLGSYLLLGIGEEKSGGRDRKNVLADAFEAFIGAIYLDQGYEKVKKVVHQLFSPLIESLKEEELIDYKTKLQELIQADTRKTVEYIELSKSGSANNPIYEFAVVLDGNLTFATGKGKSKKAAQQEAAKNALEKCAM